MLKNAVRVSLSESNQVLVSTVNKFGEHQVIELSDNDAEELLYNLHSIVMIKRGHALPASRFKRFLLHIFRFPVHLL